MFASLFPTKIEKELKALMEAGPELVLQYEGSDSIMVSQILQINRNNLILLGFYSKLEKKELVVTHLASGARIETTVSRRGNDSKGNTLFYCALPEKIAYRPRPMQRYRLRGQNKAQVLVTTNRGDKSLALGVLEISETGAVLENNSGVQIKIGTKLFQTMVTIGGGQAHLVDLQVANARRSGNGERLVCAFTREPRALGELLSLAKNQRG